MDKPDLPEYSPYLIINLIPVYANIPVNVSDGVIDVYAGGKRKLHDNILCRVLVSVYFVESGIDFFNMAPICSKHTFLNSCEVKFHY